MAELEKAELHDCDRGGKLTVLFNPKEFTVEKQVQWTQKEGAMTDEPPEEFTKPTPANLTVTLHFDTYEQKSSVMAVSYTHLDVYKRQMITLDSSTPRGLIRFAR